ncbi:MAG: NADH-quinone oxidoreductase subunit NuoE [Rhodocyclaceae bacterium]|nr:NADH-quinone oxidoreductase subunit NuoE [Rhodocyclaceae bacterium]
MLSAAEQRDIEEVLPQLPERRAACIDALQVVQRHRGWVSDEGLADAAAFLGISVEEMEGVATFYNGIFRKPVGRHVIRVCDSVSCWIMGCDRLKEALQARLGVAAGASTADGRFTLLPNVCLGHCDHGPALMVDDDLFGDVEPQALDGILDGYR